LVLPVLNADDVASDIGESDRHEQAHRFDLGASNQRRSKEGTHNWSSIPSAPPTRSLTAGGGSTHVSNRIAKKRVRGTNRASIV
jgi:hypothetical protein